MKLYEEFKEYENLWEALEDEGNQTEKEFRSEYARLSSTPEGREQLKAMDFRKRRELEQADRKIRPSYKLLSSYYTITLEYEDYNYEADAHRVFEAIHDILCFEENLAKMSNRELANKYDELWDAWSNATPEDSLEAEEAFDYFVAENLDEFVSELYDELLEDFDDFATEWAKDAGLYRWED